MKRVAVVAILVFVGMKVQAQSCVSQLYQSNGASNISILTSDPYITSANITGAISKWQACPQFGTGFPNLITANYGDYVFTVVHQSGQSTSSSGGCGYFQGSFNGFGQINGGTIVVFDATAFGQDCEPGRAVTIAHEIGHGLGLNDSSCSGYIMGPPSGGPNDTVNPAECSQADQQWSTGYETQQANQQNMCQLSCGGPCMPDGSCYPNTLSPIVVDLDGGDLKLTSVEDGVLFDMAVRGTPSRTAWTQAGVREAFLCLDRNHNGIIDNGAELFGNRTPLSTGEVASNGYEALAEYDAPALGGNGNGVIDPEDAVWPSLRLWIDTNHDGVSQPQELLPLSNAGIQYISLFYRAVGRKDRYGNVFRYMGLAAAITPDSHQRRFTTYDVFFRQGQ